jgi:hypothetical protein
MGNYQIPNFLPISRVIHKRSNLVPANPLSGFRNSLLETPGEQPEGSVLTPNPGCH